MATIRITGKLIMPNGEPAQFREVLFKRMSPDVSPTPGGGVVVDTVRFFTDINAELDAKLVPGRYVGEVADRHGRVNYNFAFTITGEEAGGVITLEELLAAAAFGDPVPYWFEAATDAASEAEQARDEAVDAKNDAEDAADLAEVYAESIQPYESREEAVAAISDLPLTVQKMSWKTTSGGLSVVRQDGATEISDMPGWVPIAPVHVGHFGYDLTAAKTSSINAAINYVSATGGGNVLLPTGDVPVQAATSDGSRAVCVMLKTGVTLSSDSDQPAILRYSRTNTDTDVISTPTIGDVDNLQTHSVELRNIIVDGGGSNSTESGRGFNYWLKRIRGLRLENVGSINPTNWGYRVEQCDTVSVQGATSEHVAVINADGFHFVDCRNVSGDFTHTKTSGDDGFIIEAMSHDIYNYDVRGLNIETPSPGVGRRAGVLIHHEGGSSNGPPRDISNILLRANTRNTGGFGLVFSGAMHIRNCQFDVNVDGGKGGVYVSLGNANHGGRMEGVIINSTVANVAEEGFQAGFFAGSYLANNTLNMTLVNAGDGFPAVDLKGDGWKGEIIVDYKNSGKSDIKDAVRINGSRNILKVTTEGGQTGVYLSPTAAGNVISLGIVDGQAGAAVSLGANASPANVFIGGRISGGITNPTYAKFIGVEGASSFDITAPARGAGVTSSPMDAVAGKMMTVGAGGVLAMSPTIAADLDATNTPISTQRTNNTTAGTWPASITSDGDKVGILWTLRFDSATYIQTLYSFGSRRLFFRMNYAGLGAWMEVQTSRLSGSTAGRPSGAVAGLMYFDTTLSKPIWYNGSGWVDAEGTAV